MGEGTWKCIAASSIALSLAAVAISSYALYELLDKVEDKLDAVESEDESLKSLIKQNVANLTSKANIDRELASLTMSMLSNETAILKRDYVKLLRDAIAINKTINYTTSSTVQRALEELESVKQTQKDIQKELQALAHLNDTAEDYLNLREELKNLTEVVNRNITRVESSLNDNLERWQNLLDMQMKSNKEISAVNSSISDVEKRLRNLENKSGNNTAGVLGQTKISKLTLNMIVVFVTFHVAQV